MLINLYRKQKGQTLPIGMALFLVLGLMSFVLFNTGQTVSDKSRLVNTADSAVYSGLLWQARAMNFQAYTNRAMVANQVAMAQAVSINSWSAYIAKTGQNLNAAFGWVPYVGAVTRILEKVGAGIDMFLNPISQGMLAVVNAVNVSVSIAQKAVFYSAFVATPDVVNSVVLSNEKENQNFKWETVFSLANIGMNGYQWYGFTENSDNNKVDAEKERFEMINASRDKFSLERDWEFFRFFIPITFTRWVRFEKAGTTELLHKDGKYEWYAKDALSLRQKKYTWRGKRYSDIPISGGSSFANSDSSDQTIMGQEPMFFGGRHRVAQTSTSGGSSDILSFHGGRSMKYYGGIQAYRSLSKKMREGEEPPTMKLRIQISMSTDDIMDSHEADDGSNQFNSNVTSHGNVLSSVSTGELYFEKPCFEQSCIVEDANGYNPYWDVRLVETTGLARLAAHTLQKDVLSDIASTFSTEASMNRLPDYSASLANPITDYVEQSKGVKAVINNMEGNLGFFVQGSTEYLAYKAKLDEIRANVTFEIEGIAQDYVEENLDAGQIVDKIAEAAGYDLNVDEVKTVTEFIDEIFPELGDIRNISKDDIKNAIDNKVGEIVDSKVEELKSAVEEEIAELLRDAVKNIMKGLLGSFAEQITGAERVSSDISEFAEDSASDLLNRAENELTSEGGLDDEDVEIDVSDECAMYSAINDSEREVAEMQARLEDINQQIATEFHAELQLVTAASVATRDAAIAEKAEILVQMQVISNSNRNEEDTEDLLSPKQDRLNDLNEILTGIPESRVDTLAQKLKEISDNATASEFPDFKLDIRMARNSVIETLGDINVLEVDENGNPITDNMLFGDIEDSEEELASDTDQSLTEKPEGC